MNPSRCNCYTSDDSGDRSQRRPRSAKVASSERRQGLLEVVAELLGARGMPQLRQRLGLDLPDPLTSDTELLADLFEGARMAVGQPEPQLDDLFLPLAESVQD